MSIQNLKLFGPNILASSEAKLKSDVITVLLDLKSIIFDAEADQTRTATRMFLINQGYAPLVSIEDITGLSQEEVFLRFVLDSLSDSPNIEISGALENMSDIFQMLLIINMTEKYKTEPIFSSTWAEAVRRIARDYPTMRKFL